MARTIIVGCVLALMSASGILSAQEGKSKPLTPAERARLEADSKRLNREGLELHAAGRYAEAVKQIEAALEVKKRLYPKADFPDGHAELARGINNLGFMLDSIGQPDKALPYLEEALAMRRRLYPATAYPGGHNELATSLNNLGYVLQSLGRPDRALSHYEEALATRRRLYPPERFPEGHADLAISLNNLGGVLEALGRYDQALARHEDALAMFQRLYPPEKYTGGHPHLAASVNNLGSILTLLGRPEQALPRYEEALALLKRLYPEKKFPDGHPDLARGLNNLGFALERLGRNDQARIRYEEAVAMFQRLYAPDRYPSGHPVLAASLNNLGAVLQLLDRPEQALLRHEEALAMHRQLYPSDDFPAGHPELAHSLNNLAAVLDSLGRTERALTCYKEALTMRRRLYPEDKFPAGHPELARSLNNIGAVLDQVGQSEQAVLRLEEALAMYGRLLNEQFLSASEADGLDLIRSLPLVLDSYLSATRQINGTAANAYRQVWDVKGRLTRILEGRRLSAQLLDPASKIDPKVRDALNEWLGLRRRIALLQQQAGEASKEQDQLLSDLTDRKEKKERELLAIVPEFQRARAAAGRSADNLVRVLPPNSAFIDFLRYTRFERDRKLKGGMAEKRIVSYVAFVLVPGKETVRVELKQADEIDSAVGNWRKAIAERRDDSAGAARVRNLVWEPLEKHLPESVDSVYICADFDLARVPFAALPRRRDGGVLLEEFAIATVPHGPFLLEQLLNPRKYDGNGSLLSLGGVKYGDGGRWAFLDGTAAEVAQLEAVKNRPSLLSRLTGADADASHLAAKLPQARYAHLATHGYFDAEAVAAEERKQDDYRERLKGYEFQAGHTFGRSGGAGKRSPLGYVGLVLAGANNPAAAVRPTGVLGGSLMAALQPSPIFSGDRIAELPLEKLRLVTLSACETGLGDYTGGEGVQGLQRAFHLAGAENVLCTLWDVNDEATAALMRRYYHHLWDKKEPPIQALRLAQLELYRNPTQVTDLVRGQAPKFSGATKPLPKAEQPPTGDRAATKLWAAFVLSGGGR